MPLGFGTGFQIGTSIQDRRERQRIDAENRSIELRKSGFTIKDGEVGTVPGGPADLQERQNKNTEILLNSLESKVAAQDGFNALADYANTGKAAFLQSASDRNPKLKQANAQIGINLFADIDFENDSDILLDAGVTREMQDTPEKIATLRKNLFKIHDGQGWKVGTLQRAVQMTGALPALGARGEIFVTNLTEMQNLLKVEFERSEAREATILESRAARIKAAQGVSPTETAAAIRATRAKSAIEIAKVVQKGEEIETKAGFKEREVGVKEEQVVLNRRLVVVAENKSQLDKLRLSLDKKKARLSGLSAKGKRLHESIQAEIDLVEAFGGPEQFEATDFNERENLLKASPFLTLIDKDLSEADKKSVQQINQLIALSDPASQLSPAETGIINNFLLPIEEFLTNNVKGVAARSAFAAFRNITRHILFGAALTEFEIRENNKALGSLGKKLGPVLAQFQVQMGQVQAKLNTISRLNNPLVARVLLGVSEKRLARMQGVLTTEIRRLQGFRNGEAASNTRKPKSREESKQRALEIIN